MSEADGQYPDVVVHFARVMVGLAGLKRSPALFGDIFVGTIYVIEKLALSVIWERLCEVYGTDLPEGLLPWSVIAKQRTKHDNIP